MARKPKGYYPVPGGYMAQLTIDGRPVRRRAKTEAEAKKRYAELQVQKRLQLKLRGAPRTVGDLLTRWLEYHVKPDLRQNTYDGYAHIIERMIRPHLGYIRLLELTPDDVRRWLVQLSKHYARNTVKNARARLHAALETAVENEWVARNVASRVKVPAGPVRKRIALSSQQAQLLVAALEKERLGAMMLLSLAHGLRLGELRALTWRDVDLKGAVLQVRQATVRTGKLIEKPKNGRTHTIHLPSETVALLERQWDALQRERRQRNWVERGLVFPSERGTIVGEKTVRRVLTRACAAAHIPRITVHELRHSHGSIAHAEGVSIAAVAASLNHADPALTVRTYVHASDKETRQTAATVWRAIVGDTAANHSQFNSQEGV